MAFLNNMADGGFLFLLKKLDAKPGSYMPTDYQLFKDSKNELYAGGNFFEFKSTIIETKDSIQALNAFNQTQSALSKNLPNGWDVYNATPTEFNRRLIKCYAYKRSAYSRPEQTPRHVELKYQVTEVAGTSYEVVLTYVPDFNYGGTYEGGLIKTFKQRLAYPATADLRRTFLKLIEEKKSNFKNIRGELIKATKHGSAYYSTIHFAEYDDPVIEAFADDSKSLYKNVVMEGATEEITEKAFAEWQKRIAIAMPEYNSGIPVKEPGMYSTKSFFSSDKKPLIIFVEKLFSSVWKIRIGIAPANEDDLKEIAALKGN